MADSSVSRFGCYTNSRDVTGSGVARVMAMHRPTLSGTIGGVLVSLSSWPVVASAPASVA